MIRKFKAFGKSRTIHLHAGFHKTGTSAIQNYLYSNLQHRDFHYLDTGMANGSLFFLRCFKENISDIPRFKQRNRTQAEWDDIRRTSRKQLFVRLNATKKRNVIASAESISLFTQEEITDLVSYLSDIFDAVKVYFYVRPHKSRVESAFQEKLKSQLPSLAQKYVFDFRRSIGQFDSLLGEENVFVRKYQPDELLNQCVVSDFLAALGLSPEAPPTDRSNKSLTLPAVKLLYAYRKFNPIKQDFDTHIINKLKNLPGDRFHFHGDLFKECFQEREAAEKWFRKRVNFVLEENIHEHDDIGIRSEGDLLSFTDFEKEWLCKFSSTAPKSGASDNEDLESISRSVAGLT